VCVLEHSESVLSVSDTGRNRVTKEQPSTWMFTGAHSVSEAAV